MISESVYYMDRGHGTLVTDQQVVIDGRHYDLAVIRDARIKSKPISHTGVGEIGLRILSLVALVDAMAIKLFLWGSELGQTLLGIDLLLFTVSLSGLLFFTLTQKSHRVVVLNKLNGTSEELFDCDDRRHAWEFVQAVRDATADYQAGHSANARRPYRK